MFAFLSLFAHTVWGPRAGIILKITIFNIFPVFSFCWKPLFPPLNGQSALGLAKSAARAAFRRAMDYDDDAAAALEAQWQPKNDSEVRTKVKDRPLSENYNRRRRPACKRT